MTPLQSVITRWDATIAGIHQQFERVLDQAWHASAPMVADTRLDLVPLTQVWGAVEHQLRRHTTRVADAWDEISEVLSSQDGLAEDTMWREGNKRDVASRELELRHTQYYRTLMAQAAERMRQHAVLTDAARGRCGCCGGALAGTGVVAQAHDVRCGACGTSTTVEPGDAWRIFAASGARCLAEAVALEAYEAMVRAEIAIDGARDRKSVPLDALVHLETCAHRYWRCVFETEARYVPEQGIYVAAKIERHMHDVRRKLAQYWQWRRRVG